MTNLTRNPALDRFPLWTSDGKQFVFVSDRDGMSAIYRQTTDGISSPELMSELSPDQQTPNAITPDGRQLIFDRRDDLFELELDGSRRVRQLTSTASLESRAALSPDGRLLAFISNESGEFEVYVAPLDAVDGPKIQISTAGGIQPWWNRDGTELYFAAPTNALMYARVRKGEPWSADAPAVLVGGAFNYQATNRTAAPIYDASADARRFLIVREVTDAPTAQSLRSIVVVQDWFAEIRRVVPGN
jgi:Tol biopolymer transport system component